MSLTSNHRNLIRSSLPLLVLLIVLFAPGTAGGHDNPRKDSIKKNLSQAQADAEKVDLLSTMADEYFNSGDNTSDNYAARALQTAEQSRDRKLIIGVYLRNGRRLLYWGQNLSSNTQRAKENFLRAEKLARENGLDDELAGSYLWLAQAAEQAGDHEKSLNYSNQALAIATTGKSDSLKMESYIAVGDAYNNQKEKLMAFRNYLNALDIAELTQRDILLKGAYRSLTGFYKSIQEVDKAIDYQFKALEIDRKKNWSYPAMDDYADLGRLYLEKKEPDLALDMFEHVVVISDSLKTDYRVNFIPEMMMIYQMKHEIAKGINYLKEHPELEAFHKKVGTEFEIDELYGRIYAELGKFDSAYYFLKKAEPGIEQKGDPNLKYKFYIQFGTFYKDKGDNKEAIQYFLKARETGKAIQNLDILQISAANLDTLYDRSGDYKNAYYYNSQYNLYKDSIQSLARETDLLKLEVDNDNKRHERLAREEEEQTQHRHNVQYMGFTIGIAGLFVLLAMLGFFVISPRVIRALGFVSFIFLFEFIILLADKQIHEWTHGEPWKILIIKILLAAILLPLHHWLEHRVIHFLMSRRKSPPVPGTAIAG